MHPRVCIRICRERERQREITRYLYISIHVYCKISLRFVSLWSFAGLSNHSQKRVPLGTLKNIGEYTVEMRPSDKKEDSTS